MLHIVSQHLSFPFPSLTYYNLLYRILTYICLRKHPLKSSSLFLHISSSHKIKLLPLHGLFCSEKLFLCFAFGIIKGLAKAVLCTHVEGKTEH